GTFQPATRFPVSGGPTAVAIGDFNGDGQLDLVTANIGGNTVAVLLGDASAPGTFQMAVSYAVGINPESLAIGDFTVDGQLDLAVANTAANTVSVLLAGATALGTFQPAVNYAVGARPSHVALGDYNGDGALDLAVANSSAQSVSVLLGNRNGTF